MQLVEPGDGNRPTPELAPRKEDNRQIQRSKKRTTAKDRERELEKESE